MPAIQLPELAGANRAHPVGSNQVKAGIQDD